MEARAPVISQTLIVTVFCLLSLPSLYILNHHTLPPFIQYSSILQNRLDPSHILTFLSIHLPQVHSQCHLKQHPKRSPRRGMKVSFHFVVGYNITDVCSGRSESAPNSHPMRSKADHLARSSIPQKCQLRELIFPSLANNQVNRPYASSTSTDTKLYHLVQSFTSCVLNHSFFPIIDHSSSSSFQLTSFSFPFFSFLSFLPPSASDLY